MSDAKFLDRSESLWSDIIHLSRTILGISTSKLIGQIVIAIDAWDHLIDQHLLVRGKRLFCLVLARTKDQRCQQARYDDIFHVTLFN